MMDSIMLYVPHYQSLLTQLHPAVNRPPGSQLTQGINCINHTDNIFFEKETLREFFPQKLRYCIFKTCYLNYFLKYYFS